jgi:iron complex transport system substrate-binding protein
MITASAPRRIRAALAAVGAATVLVVLAACGTSGGQAASADDATRTVSTAKGDVKVPVHPTRIVSIQSYATESLLDLGVTPVGIEDTGEQYVPQRYLARWKKITKVAKGADVDFEKIASLKPDLIVGVDVPYLDKDYDKLTAIAPTVFAPFSETSTWEDYPKSIGGFVNDVAGYEKLRSGYDAEIARVKKDYAAQLSTLRWDVIQGGFDEGNFWIYPTDTPASSILASIGAQFASATASAPSGSTDSVSYEQASLLTDATAILYYENNDGTPANNIDKLFSLQSYQQLTAVKNGMAVGTPDFLPGSYSDAEGIVHDVEAALKKAAAKG